MQFFFTQTLHPEYISITTWNSISMEQLCKWCHNSFRIMYQFHCTQRGCQNRNEYNCCICKAEWPALWVLSRQITCHDVINAHPWCQMDQEMTKCTCNDVLMMFTTWYIQSFMPPNYSVATIKGDELPLCFSWPYSTMIPM